MRQSKSTTWTPWPPAIADTKYLECIIQESAILLHNPSSKAAIPTITKTIQLMTLKGKCWQKSGKIVRVIIIIIMVVVVAVEWQPTTPEKTTKKTLWNCILPWIVLLGRSIYRKSTIPKKNPNKKSKRKRLMKWMKNNKGMILIT